MNNCKIFYIQNQSRYFIIFFMLKLWQNPINLLFKMVKKRVIWMKNYIFDAISLKSIIKTKTQESSIFGTIIFKGFWHQLIQSFLEHRDSDTQESHHNMILIEYTQLKLYK